MAKLLPHCGLIQDGMHKLPLRVYYEDTDAGGIVYHAHYLKYLERGRSDFLRLLGIKQSEMLHFTKEGDVQFVVKKCEIDYHAPAYLDDALILITMITKLGRASLMMEQTLYREKTLLLTALIKIGVIGHHHKPTSLPPHIKQKLMTKME